MLIAFSFQAKRGREKEFEAFLSSPQAARAVGRAMGMARNTLFLGNGRMIRVVEIPDGATPPSILDVAKRDPIVMEFLRKIGPLVEDGFDIDRPETLEAFNKKTTFPLAYDLRF